jgi:group I intron endonuclease
MKSGIYIITNKVNSKIYVGSGVDAFRRWREHKSDLNLNRHNNGRLQNAWNKYGSEAFDFEIVEFCDKDILLAREQFWLDATLCYDKSVGYNIVKIAGRNIGHKHSEETKKRMSEYAKNKSIEHRRKIGLGNKGKFVSEETKIKMSLAAKGKPKTKEHAANIVKGKQLKKSLNILFNSLEYIDEDISSFFDSKKFSILTNSFFIISILAT